MLLDDEVSVEAMVIGTSDSPLPFPLSLSPEVSTVDRKERKLEVSVAGESMDHPLVVIASQEELGGEDAEVTGAFSGEYSVENVSREKVLLQIG